MNWDIWVLNSVHKATGEIPSVLLFGVSQRRKIHDPVSEFLKNDVNVDIRNLDLVRNRASQNIVKQQSQVKAQGDKKRKIPILPS